MTVKEYAKLTDVTQITFIKARARKDANTPFYHAEYQTTPLYFIGEVITGGILSDYIILNDKQGAISWLCGADWNNGIRGGWARCLLVISPADFETLYPSERQRAGMISYIDKRLTF